MTIWKFDDSVLIMPCGCQIKGILVYCVLSKPNIICEFSAVVLEEEDFTSVYIDYL
jgi:hypothetical protein